MATTDAKKKKLFSEENPSGITDDPGRVPMTKKPNFSLSLNYCFSLTLRKQPGD